MLTNDLFNTDYERRLQEGAVDRLEQRRIDDLNMKMDDLAHRAKSTSNPEHKKSLLKAFLDCKQERDSYYKLREAGIGQDIVNKSEKMARATPQSKTGAVASTVKNAAKWLAGKGGPGREGPTYEGADDIEDRGEYDREGDMAKDNIHTIVRNARELESVIGNDDNLPEWVQDKLANIKGMMTAVSEYMQTQHERDSVVPEGTETQWSKEEPWRKVPKNKSGQPVDPRGEVAHLSDVARREAERKAQPQKKNSKEVAEHGGGIGPKQRWQDAMEEYKPVTEPVPQPKKLNPGWALHPTTKAELKRRRDVRNRKGVDEVADTNYTYTVFIDGTKEGTYGSKEEARAVVARKKQQAPGRDYRIAPKSRTSAASIKRFQKNRDRADEGFQDFNKVEPYAVCLAGKPVKKFDYYEEARRFHDNWKKKLYREGDKDKADKITLMPLNLDEGDRFNDPMGYNVATSKAAMMLGYNRFMDVPNSEIDKVHALADKIQREKHRARTMHEDDPMGGATVAIGQMAGADRDTNPTIDEDTGSWIVYDPATKQIKKRFKTHTAGKSYAKTHNLGFASSEYYFDNIKTAVTAEGMTDFQKRRQRERDIDAGRPVARQRPSKQTDYQRRRAQDRKDMELGEDQDTSGVESAIIRRIMVAHTDWLQKFGPEKVMQAAEEVAYNVGAVDEIGTSDVSAYVHEVGQILGVDQINEKWSQTYKDNINCADPKGFSQRAHCAGKKK